VVSLAFLRRAVEALEDIAAFDAATAEGGSTISLDQLRAHLDQI
jgi:hypothetical protein